MKHYIQIARTFVTTHRRKIAISAAIGIGALAIVIAIMLFIYNLPKDTYQAVNACDLLTPAKAQDLLGDKVISIDTKDPVIADNTSTSKCSYTNNDPNKSKMIVAAIAVRAGINTKGIQQNKALFTAKKPTTNTEDVKDLGDSAYFNKTLGQLNILDNRKWIIVSYGFGATPESNQLDKAIELAKKVLH